MGLSGDVNGDGVVNGLDIADVASHWLQTGIQVPGDANGDGIVNGLDIAAISSNWLATTPPSPSAGSPSLSLNFANGLTGWTVGQSGGSASGQGTVVANQGDVVLTEGDSLLVTLKRTIAIPSGVKQLDFTYKDLSFDTSSQGRIKDAFEVALLDNSGHSLVDTIGTGRDAYFNISEGQPAAFGDGASANGTTVSLDVTGISAGTQATLVFRLINNDGDVNTSVRLSGINQAPTGANNTVTTLENTAYTFATGDFGFSDPADLPPNNLLAVEITTLPAAGKLTDNGVAVTAGQFVAATDIASGLLKFTPASGAYGSPYSSFTFQVEDDGGTANGGANLDPSPKTITIDVSFVGPANDKLGLLLLDPTGKGALTDTGNGSVVVNNGGSIVVDSIDSQSAILTGNGNVSAADIDVTGGTRTSGHGQFLGTIDHEAAIPDPLGLPLPAAPSTTFAAVNYSGSTPLTLNPGTYIGGIKVSGQASVILNPGIYYMKGGGFSITGQGTVTGNGVLIVNAPTRSSDTVSFTGQGAVNLTPPASLAAPYTRYAGINIFQDPASNAPINITGRGVLTTHGVFYAPKALLNITGQGGMVVNAGGTSGSPAEVIVYDAQVTGNGGLTINLAKATTGFSTGSSTFAMGNGATAASVGASNSIVVSDRANGRVVADRMIPVPVSQSPQTTPSSSTTGSNTAAATLSQSQSPASTSTTTPSGGQNRGSTFVATTSAPVLVGAAPNTPVAHSLGTTSQAPSLPDAPDSKGKDFWLTFPNNHSDQFHIASQLLYISSAVSTTGAVTIPGLSFSRSFSVTPGAITTIGLPTNADLGPTSDVVTNKGIHVTAQDAISVYGFSSELESSDAFLGLPTDTLGTDYIVLSYSDSPVGSGRDYNGTEFAFVATADNTTVTVAPTISGLAPYQVHLNQGNTYQFQKTSGEGDLSGTVITSDKPIGVFGGNELAEIPAGYTAADYLVQELPPVKAWGREFATLPEATRANGDTFRFLASADNTTVKIDGKVVAILDRGHFYETVLTQPSYVVANNPILVAQYANSYQYDGLTGDPSMMLIPPIEQFLADYTVITPDNVAVFNSNPLIQFGPFPINYINLVAPATDVGAITVDGQAVPVDQFTPIGTSSFYGAQVHVNAGAHNLSGPAAFGAFVYGFASFDAYGYPAGMSLAPVATVANVVLSPHAASASLANPVTLTATVTDANGNPVEGVRVEFSVTGTNPQTTFAFTDAQGNAQLTYTSQKTGNDTVVATVSTFSDISTVNWEGEQPQITITSPAEQSQLTAGTTVLVSGHVTIAPHLSLISVSVNQMEVTSIDASGNFFAQLQVMPGSNVFTLTATDSLGQTAQTQLTLVGINSSSRKPQFDSLSNISASFQGVYAQSSFNEASTTLFADMAVEDTGTYPVGNPLMVGIANISNPLVRVIDADGVTPEGVPYFDYSALVSGKMLAPGGQTGFRTLEFSDSPEVPFTYNLVFVGQLNQPPTITTVPNVQAIAGTTYAYAVGATDPDGNPLTFSLTTAPVGMTIDKNTGQISWSAAAADVGTQDVTIVVSDGLGGTAQQHYLLSVINPPPNLPPMFTSTPVTVAHLSALYSYPVTASDPDGDPLSFSLANAPAGMTIDANTGLIGWTPTLAQLGTDPVTVQVSDGQGETATQAYVVQVLPQIGDHPPQFTSSPPTTALVGQPYQYQAQAVDPDIDMLTYSLPTAPAGMTIDGTTGLISWSPTSNQIGPQNVNVVVSDGRGGSDSQTFAINVTSNAPGEIQGTVFLDQNQDGTQDNGEPGLAGWTVYLDQNQNGILDAGEVSTTTDANGNYTFANLAPGTYFVAEQGQIGYTQTTTSFASYRVNVTAGQTSQGIDFGDATRAVNTDRSPVFDNAAPTTATVGQLYRYAAQVTDPDGDPLTFTLPAAPAGMTVDANTGVVVWTPTPDQVTDPNYPQNMVLRVSDGRGGIAVQTVRIAVAPADTPPVITSTPPSQATVGLPYQYQVQAQDADGNPLTYSLSTFPTGMRIDPTTGLVSWTPTSDQLGSQQQVVLIAIDSQGGVATQTFDVTVVASSTDHPPVITSSPLTSVLLGRTYSYQVVANDPDGDPLSYSLTSQPAGMTITNSGLVQWTPTPSQLGSASVSLVVDDGRGGTATQSFTVQVVTQPVSGNPQITSVPPGSATVGNQYIYNAQATDPIGGAILWSLDQAPQGMSIDPNQGSIYWTPTANQLGPQTVVVRATDTQAATTTQSFSINVSAVNLPPAITSTPSTQAAVGQAYTYAVAASDPDGDVLTFSLPTAPAGMSINTSTGLIQWTPTSSEAGLQLVTVQVSDGQGGVVQQSYGIGVSSTTISQPPQITSSPPSPASVGALYQYQVTATDPNGDPLTFSLTQPPAGMTIDPNSGLLQWTPTSAQLGSQPITIRATDSVGLASTQSFTLPVLPPDHPPVFTSTPPLTVSAGATYAYDVRATDPDGDLLAISLTTAPAGMTIDNMGRLRWATTATDIGTVNVVVQVSDGRGGIATQPFQLQVVPDTTPPKVAISLSEDPVKLGDTLIVQVSATDDVGVVGETLTVNGTPISLTASGQGTYVPAAAGSLNFVATASDAAGNVGQATATSSVYDPRVTTAPDVEITSPTNDQTITSALDVMGTVNDPNLVSYTLAIGTPGSDSFTTIAQGTTSIVNGVLGKLDPSQLSNDAYVLQLTAENTGNQISTIDVPFAVSGKLKLGDFTRTFTDLTVPVSGIPIVIERTYDTLNANQQGDFGYGWRLEYRDTDLRTSVAPTSQDQQDLGIYNAFYYGAHVYVTLPGGTREGFTFEPQPVTGIESFLGSFGRVPVTPTFVPDPGVTDTLSIATGQTLYVNQSTGEVLDYADDSPFNPASPSFNISDYTLTTKDGIVYQINATTGRMDSVSDTNGNKLTFSDSGISSSSGQQITFQRDPQGRITAVIDPAGQKITYAYNAAGNLAGVTDRQQNTTTFQYRTDFPHYLDKVIDPLNRPVEQAVYDPTTGRLMQLIDAGGKKVSIAYDPADLTETTTDQLGNPTTYVYDTQGNIKTEIDALGHVSTRMYDTQNNLLSETDPLGNTTTHTYDLHGNVLTTIDALGNANSMLLAPQHTTTYTYDAFNNLLTTTDPLGNTITNTYDYAHNPHNLLSTSGGATGTRQMAYDGAGNLTSVTDANGITAFTYDGAGHVRTQTDPLGNVTTFTYDANGNQRTQTTTLTTPSGVRTLVTKTDYDANGRVIQSTDAEGGVTQTKYDAAGQKIAVIDALGHTTKYEYDDRGELITTIYPDLTPLDDSDNPRTKSEYDAAGHVTADIDQLGRRTEYVYDALGRKTTTIPPDNTPLDDTDNPRTLTSYDDVGNVATTTDALGNVTTYKYDADNRRITTILPDNTPQDTIDNPQISEQYDAAGRHIATTDPLGHTTKYVYDNLGRLSETIYADGTTSSTTYYPSGQPHVQTDPNGHTTSDNYDAAGRLKSVIDAAGKITAYDYDEAGNLITQTDANGHVTHYEYDGLGHRTATVLPLGQRSITSYDPVGNVKSTTDFMGQTITFDYDLLNRLVTKTYPDQLTVAYTYTLTGKPETVVDSRGRTTYTYDAQDRLLSDTESDGSQLAYTYDAAGNRTSLILSSGTTHYTYDAQNRLSTVTDPQGGVTSNQYDLAGNLFLTKLPNGASEIRQYDSLNRLAYLENDGPGGVIDSFRYTLDKAGNRTRVVENTGREVDYLYDALDRLTEEKIADAVLGNRTIDYTYDAVGNRLTMNDSAAGLTSDTYDANDRLLTETLAAAVTQYKYDNNGDVLSQVQSATDQVFYNWDFDHRLAGESVTQGSTTQQIKNQYDADGNRVSQTVNGQKTLYLIDKNVPVAQLVEQYTPGGVIQASYVFGNQIISERQNGATSYYHVDGLGSVRALTNASGVVTDRYVYDAFGRMLSQTGTTANPFLFAGQQSDGSSGLYYMRARYYDPAAGRFYGQDPVGATLQYPVSLDRYLYAGDNPVDRIDPSGQQYDLGSVLAAVNIVGVLASIAPLGGVTAYSLLNFGSAPDAVGFGFFGAIESGILKLGPAQAGLIAGFEIVFAPRIKQEALYAFVGAEASASLGLSHADEELGGFEAWYWNIGKSLDSFEPFTLGGVQLGRLFAGGSTDGNELLYGISSSLDAGIFGIKGGAFRLQQNMEVSELTLEIGVAAYQALATTVIDEYAAGGVGGITGAIFSGALTSLWVHLTYGKGSSS